jgi:hypothetical protein
MTREAAQRGRAFSIGSALDVHGVRMIVVALQRAVTRHMAVQTARAGENGCNSAEGLQALLDILRARLWTSGDLLAELRKAEKQN